MSIFSRIKEQHSYLIAILVKNNVVTFVPGRIMTAGKYP
jgi:uncharacterized membrane protein